MFCHFDQSLATPLPLDPERPWLERTSPAPPELVVAT
jgi:hypothetical protein